MKVDSLFISKVKAGWQFLSFTCFSAFPMVFWEETWLRGCHQQHRFVRQCSWRFWTQAASVCVFTLMPGPLLQLWEGGGATRSLAGLAAALP